MQETGTEKIPANFVASRVDPSSDLTSGYAKVKVSDQQQVVLSSHASSSSDNKKLSADEISTTPLSVAKLIPLSSFFNHNNKVGSSFQSDQRQPILTYGQRPSQTSSLVLPVHSRRVRDSGALLLMFAFLGFLGYVIWDGLVVKETDINLIVHGHDSYGNICGRNNKPIKFAEKSGKNYTSKPYTKYTLINAQFERYTLDTNRLKSGELFYVKENVADKYQERSPRHPQAPLSPSPNEDERRRIKRLVSSDHFASAQEHRELLHRRNQSLLNSLKSNLMYQYPPMYSYEPAVTTTSPKSRDHQPPAPQVVVEWSRPEAMTTRRTVSGSQSGDHSEQNYGNYGRSEIILRPSQTGAIDRALGTAMSTQPPPAARAVEREISMMEHSNHQVSAMHTKTTTTTTTITTATPDLTKAASDKTKSDSNPTTQGSLPRSTAHTVMFDDEQANDTDRYEHMLVTPTVVNRQFHMGMRPSTPRFPMDGLSQSEVSSQLLYLTECVDFCPSDHVELIFYRCMPENWRFSLFPNAINVTRTFIDDILTDVSHCYKELIYIFSLALVLSLALLILLRFLASLIIWSCIALLVSLFLSMTSYSWINYYQQIIDLNNMLPHEASYAERLGSSDKWLVGSIFLTFISFAAIGMVIFMRKRILLVTKLFRESGKAIADMPLLLLQPLLTFTALVAITATWSMGLICLQSMKSPVIDMSTGFVVFKAEVLYKIMKWYHVFAFLWVSHFAIACQHYVIGASVSKWYFSPNRYELHSPIGTSISELILYYLGSVALGSFLVAIFKVVRIIMRQIQYLIQRNCMSPPGSGSQAPSGSISRNHVGPAQLSSPCCGSFSYVWRMFIWFFDNIVMIINRDAYVEIAIYGHSFVGGARRAFYVISNNPLRLLAIKSVSNILLVVAKICVVLGTVGMAAILLEEKTSQLNYSWSPMFISAIYAYVVAHWFLSVYEMVIDALFICYCEDYEKNKNQETMTQIAGSNFMSQILNNGQLY